jgi:hypothetical protein
MKKEVSVTEFLKPFPPEIRVTTNAIRKLIAQLVPNRTEKVYPGWKLIGYRVMVGSKSRYFGFIAPFPDRVVLGFEYGRLLDDPHGLLEGSDTQVRQIIIRKRAQVQRRKFAPLILQAAAVAIEWRNQ